MKATVLLIVDFTEYFFGEREFLVFPHCAALTAVWKFKNFLFVRFLRESNFDIRQYCEKSTVYETMNQSIEIAQIYFSNLTLQNLREINCIELNDTMTCMVS